MRPAPELSEDEKAQVKRVAEELLTVLKRGKIVLDWRKEQGTRAAVRVAVEETLDRLPEKFTRQIYAQKCDIVYQHVFDSYWDDGHSVYDRAARCPAQPAKRGTAPTRLPDSSIPYECSPPRSARSPMASPWPRASAWRWRQQARRTGHGHAQTTQPSSRRTPNALVTVPRPIPRSSASCASVGSFRSGPMSRA